MSETQILKAFLTERIKGSAGTRPAGVKFGSHV
jgi:hypothetical protein